MADELTRVAVVNKDRCRPNKCKLECKRSCPVVRMGKLCIEVTTKSKISFISEELCIGCGICPKKCPFRAIHIINLPKSLEKDVTHRFGPNTFKLHRLPMPRPGTVLGLVGSNGTGKSTALSVLSGRIKPNLGKFDDPPDWEEICRYFRGSELQNYFRKIVENDLVALVKPQYVDKLPRAVKGTVGKIVEDRDKRGVKEELLHDLQLDSLVERDIRALSGGELQRFAIAVISMADGDVYMFDEPSSYLDVRQRLVAAQTIRKLLANDKYVMVVEHDLSVLDYLSDFVCVLYGLPGVYGVITMPFGVREGINIFLDGFVPTENLRFRDEALQFKISETAEEEETEKIDRQKRNGYPAFDKTLGNFKLHVEAGNFTNSEIIVLLGENGTGKTTLVKLIAGIKKPDLGEDGQEVVIPELKISYKPQTINPSFDGTVKEMLMVKMHEKKIGNYQDPQFQADVLKPLSVDTMLDRRLKNLSGGELQRVAIVLALCKVADVYLIDEPSAYLDSEQRIIAAKVIKRFVMHNKRTAMIVEHDFIMATYLADRVIVYDGKPGVECTAHRPEGMLVGMNRFLKSIEVTFRRDPVNYRPRINKFGSIKDREQKYEGNYFFIE